MGSQSSSAVCKCCDRGGHADGEATHIWPDNAYAAYLPQFEPRNKVASPKGKRQVTFGHTTALEAGERPPARAAASTLPPAQVGEASKQEELQMKLHAEGAEIAPRAVSRTPLPTSASTSPEASPAPPPVAELDAPEANPSYYQEWASIRAALAGGDTILLRGSWVEAVFLSGGTLPRRQDLPAEAIWPPEELLQDVLDYRRPTPQILAISYTWLGPGAADPEGFHLRRFAPLLRHLARHRCQAGAAAIAIFLDWCSVPQLPRTRAEADAFQRSQEYADLWFAHQLTDVWLMTEVPPGATPHAARGWPAFERAVATFVSRPESVIDIGLLKPGWTDWSQVEQECQATWAPPLPPERFAQILESKKFHVPADLAAVADKYRETFARALGGADKLNFAGLGWGDLDAQQLAEVLPSCKRLKELELGRNDVGASGARALAQAFARCPAMHTFGLSENRLGDRAVRELAAAWKSAGKEPVCLDIRTQRHCLRPHSLSSTRSPSSSAPASPTGRGGLPGTPSSADTGFSGRSDLSIEQVTALAARQAAFEARVNNALSRLKVGLESVGGAPDGSAGPLSGAALGSPLAATPLARRAASPRSV